MYQDWCYMQRWFKFHSKENAHGSLGKEQMRLYRTSQLIFYLAFKKQGTDRGSAYIGPLLYHFVFNLCMMWSNKYFKAVVLQE